MRINKFNILTITLASTLFLTACQTGSGQSRSKQWDYGSSRSKSAESAPRPLGDIYAGNTDAASARTGVDLSAPIPPQTPVATTANLPTVKVALLAPLSGKHAKLGQSMLNAAQIALFDVGHSNYQLIPKDTRGTPDGARKATQEATKEGAQLILGPLFAESVRAAKPIAAQSRVNMLAFSTDWTLAGANTFIMGFLPFDQVQRLTKYAAASNLNRIGMIAPNDNYGRVVTNAFNNVAPKYGLQTITSQNFNPRSRNLGPDVRSFAKYDTRKATNAPPPYDAVLMPTGGQTAITIANLMTQYDLPPNSVKRLGTGLMDDTGLAGEPGLNGAWFAAPSPNLRREFEQKYMSTYARKPPRLATLAYDATALSAILAQRGLQNEGRPYFDRNSLMNPNGFFGIDGIFRFRTDGTAERGLAILEFARGRINVIDEAPSTFEQTQY